MAPGNQYGLHSAASFGDRSSGQHRSFNHIQNDACAAMIAHTFQSIDEIDGRHDPRDEDYGVGGKSRKGGEFSTNWSLDAVYQWSYIA